MAKPSIEPKSELEALVLGAEMAVWVGVAIASTAIGRTHQITEQANTAADAFRERYLGKKTTP